MCTGRAAGFEPATFLLRVPAAPPCCSWCRSICSFNTLKLSSLGFSTVDKGLQHFVKLEILKLSAAQKLLFGHY